MLLLFVVPAWPWVSAAEPPDALPPFRLLAALAPAAASPPTAAQLHRLIEALGDADYFVREKAATDLAKLRFDAVDALTAATEHADMEVAMRVRRLLRVIRSDWTVPGESPVVSSLLADYESQDDGNRALKTTSLADLPHNQGAAAICRIIRYDRSLLLAKTAAVRLLQAWTADSVDPALAATLQKGLAACRRAPAQWILAWLQAGKNPQALAGLWTQLAAEEEDALFRQPRDSSLTVVESLLRFQIAALRKIDRGADAAGSIEKLIQLRRGEPAELGRLLTWLIDQEDWPATRLVENRCQTTIAESSDLLYLVAEAQIHRGAAAAAEQSARLALKLNPQGDVPSLAMHLQAGTRLEQAGHYVWATKEWQHVIETAPPQSAVGIMTARLLAELHHDQEENHPAAETLQGVEKAFAGRSNHWQLLEPDTDGRDPLTLGMLRARMDFCEACHWKAQGALGRQRQCLDRALASDCYDIEVLIECYRMPDSTADYRGKIRALIAKRLCELREQAADFGENVAAAQPCNEFAWLAANTEGDLEEALRLAKRAIELVGEQGSYCDTLARVYFAKGEYANAVMHQTRAAELLPHVRAVQKQLALFRKKALEKGIPLETIPKLPKTAAPIPIEKSTAPDDNPFG